jgi:orotate phosphoribosyltransferase
LVVNDLTTTGSGLKHLIDIAESYNGKVVGVCVFASRDTKSSNIKHIKKNYNFHTTIEFEMETWEVQECPLCANEEPFIKSVDLNSLENTVPIKRLLKPLKNLKAA